MRLRICLGIIVLIGLALALKIRHLSGLVSEETLRIIVAIDVGAVVALFIYAIAVLSSHQARLKDIVRGIAVFRGGRKEYRVPTRGGGTITDLAKQVNLLLAGGDEEETSGASGFRRIVRPGEVTDPRMRAQILGAVARPGASQISAAPGDTVGSVKVRARDSANDSEEPTELPPSPQPQPTNDTDISGPRDSMVDEPEPAVEVAEPQAAPEPAVEPESQQLLPSESESGVAFVPALSTPGAVNAESEEIARRELFETFVAEKKRLGESTDELEFDTFDQELDDVAEQLKRDKGCDDVRFDVRVADGKVAVQPRLVRAKAQQAQ